MGIVVPIRDFKKPVRGKKRFTPKGIKGVYNKKFSGETKFRVYINKDKYIALYHKAKKECNTAAPVHDVLELLVQYFVENEFLIHRRLYPIDSVRTEIEKVPKGGMIRKQMPEDEDNPIRVWMRIPKYTGDKLETKQKTEGVNKSYILNLLIDFYLSKQFYIKTKVIRTTKYWKAPPKDK